MSALLDETRSPVTTIQPRRAIRAMPEYHPPLAGRTALRLDFNENTHAPSPRVREALGKLTLESFTIYPERAPVEAVVAAQLGLKPEQVLLTNAVDEAIHIVCFTFLEEGDETLFAVPSFFMYDVNATAMGSVVKRVQMDETLEFPFERVLAGITPKTKLIILCSPNNPTGTVISREQVHAIAHAAPHAVVMVDEAYFHFFGETVMHDLCDVAPADVPRNMIVARTFSKAYGLANLRVGLLAGPAELMQHMRKACSPYNVNGVALRAVEACVGDTEYIDWYVEQIRNGRARIEKALDHMRVPRWPSHANFVLMHIGPKHKEFVAAARARGVLLRDRSSDPGLAGCVRITVGVEDQVDTAIAVLRDSLAAIGWMPVEVDAPETTPKEEREYE
ncbi:pyridoxal phosphate-dependent aminotransferase [Terriglobus sp.]|uniref:pyridoxal phosphate-dependent aminotransferase n=1 Tax=Terriglobus sp. TaxID=1889013 RepID=UPI003AFFF552